MKKPVTAGPVIKNPGALHQYKARGFECVCGNLRMASRAITQIYDEHLRPSGLGANQLAVLWGVLAMEPVSVGKLARRIVVDDTTLIRNLRLLERQEMVRIVPGEDRRQRVACLTVKGRGAVTKAMPLWEEAQRDLSGKLGSRESAALSRALLKVAELAR